MGRTRPNDVALGAKGANSAGLGALGNAARTARPAAVELSMITVVDVVPSKIKESWTTWLKASRVVSAKEALNNHCFRGAY